MNQRPDRNPFMVAMWDRQLTDEEMRALADNPWQMFARRRPWWRRLFDYLRSGW